MNHFVAILIALSYVDHDLCSKQPSPFSNVHLRNTTKIAAQVLALNFLLYLLLRLLSQL